MVEMEHQTHLMTHMMMMLMSLTQTQTPPDDIACLVVNLEEQGVVPTFTKGWSIVWRNRPRKMKIV